MKVRVVRPKHGRTRFGWHAVRTGPTRRVVVSLRWRLVTVWFDG